MKYTVHFEIGGNQMRGTIDAVSIDHAKERVRQKVTFHSVERVEEKQPEEPEIVKFMKGFGI